MAGQWSSSDVWMLAVWAFSLEPPGSGCLMAPFHSSSPWGGYYFLQQLADISAASVFLLYLFLLPTPIRQLPL